MFASRAAKSLALILFTILIQTTATQAQVDRCRLPISSLSLPVGAEVLDEFQGKHF
jgi:hypothetical protein